jgi:hypothetical protein
MALNSIINSSTDISCIALDLRTHCGFLYVLWGRFPRGGSSRNRAFSEGAVFRAGRSRLSVGREF